MINNRVETMRPFLSNLRRVGLDLFIGWKYVEKNSFGQIWTKICSATFEKRFYSCEQHTFFGKFGITLQPGLIPVCS